MTTLSDLLTDLKTLDQNLPLVFTTDEGEIGGGYHVTELKAARINSIDCGGNLTDWVETNLQLLDGTDREHMKVGRFVNIAQRSIAAVEELSSGPLSFEYSPRNIGLRRYHAAQISPASDKIELKLTEGFAECKALNPIKSHENAAKNCCKTT